MLELTSAVVLAAFEATALAASEKQFFKRFPVAGVTLFRRNISPDQNLFGQTLRQLKHSHYGLPLIVAIDQEGGRVTRMPKGFPDLGAPLKIGKDDPLSHDVLRQIKSYGFDVGSQLLKSGINVNFAPVLDINTNPANVAIGDRAWGHNVDAVVQRAGSYLSGLRGAGVFGCLKHFPGQGDASADTHLTGTAIHSSRAQLFARELMPFVQLLPKSEMIMISHCVYSDLDSLPASLSYKIQTELLKNQFSYNGLILSDDMNMKAIEQDTVKWVDQLEQAILAGSDLLVICRDTDRIAYAIEDLTRRASSSKVLASRIFESADRVNKVRRRLK